MGFDDGTTIEEQHFYWLSYITMLSSHEIPNINALFDGIMLKI